MMETLFFAVLIIAFLLTVLTVADDELAWPVLAIPAWIICAVTVTGLERPYSVVVNGVAQTQTYSYSGGPFMQYLFLAFGLVLIGIFFGRVMEVAREAQKAKAAKVAKGELG